jgi:hypothetical protein
MHEDILSCEEAGDVRYIVLEFKKYIAIKFPLFLLKDLQQGSLGLFPVSLISLLITYFCYYLNSSSASPDFFC